MSRSHSYEKTCLLIALVATLATCLNSSAQGSSSCQSVELSCTGYFGTFSNNVTQTIQCSGDSSYLGGFYKKTSGETNNQTAEGWVVAPTYLEYNGMGGPIMFSVSFSPNGTNGSFSGNMNMTYSKQCTDSGQLATQYIYLYIPFSGTTVSPQ
jgi:hypothetical protein